MASTRISLKKTWSLTGDEPPVDRKKADPEAKENKNGLEGKDNERIQEFRASQIGRKQTVE